MRINIPVVFWSEESDAEHVTLIAPAQTKPSKLIWVIVDLAIAVQLYIYYINSFFHLIAAQYGHDL